MAKESVFKTIQRNFDTKELERWMKGLPIFRMDIDAVSIFMENLPSDAERQDMNCNCCKDFLKRYGGLAFLDERGDVHPVLWDKDNYSKGSAARKVAKKLAKAIVDADVVSYVPRGRLLNRLKGRGATKFDHLEVDLKLRFTDVFATTIEDFQRNVNYLIRNQEEFYPGNLLDQMLDYVNNSSPSEIPRHKQLTGSLKSHETFRKLLNEAESGKSKKVRYYLAATNYGGSLKIKGTVLEIFSNAFDGSMSQEDALDLYSRSTDPLEYQRPVAPSSVGQFRDFAKLVKENNYEPLLKLEHATVDAFDGDVLYQYNEPAATNDSDSSIDAMLAEKEGRESPDTEVEIDSLPVKKMRYQEFLQEVVPLADRIVLANEPKCYGAGMLFKAPMVDDVSALAGDGEIVPVAVDHRSGWHLQLRPFIGRGAAIEQITVLDTKNPKLDNGGKITVFTIDTGMVNDAPKHGLARINNPLFPEIAKAEFFPYRQALNDYNERHQTDLTSGEVVMFFNANVGSGEVVNFHVQTGDVNYIASICE